MANASWPGGLPAYVLIDGFSEKLPQQALETEMEAGPPKIRRRFTTNWRQFQATIKVDGTGRALFDTFYRETLGGGTLPFDWVHPATRAAATFRFRLPPPQIAAVTGDLYTISFAMEQIA